MSATSTLSPTPEVEAPTTARRAVRARTTHPPRVRRTASPPRRLDTYTLRDASPRAAARCLVEVAAATTSTPLTPRRSGSGPRITRRGRALALAALLVAVLGLMSLGQASGATAWGDESAPLVYATVTVQPGESLWTIARHAAPAVDPRSTIARILELNGLASVDTVRAGQRLVVPATR